MEYNWTGKTILIAEDVDVNYRFLEKIFEDTNANVIRAKDGEDAVRLCEENLDIDIVLMDIQMPIMNGYEATKAIKKNRPNLPIIAQTAHAIDGGKEKGYEYGCDEYIVKPLNINKMYVVINKYIG